MATRGLVAAAEVQFHSLRGLPSEVSWPTGLTLFQLLRTHEAGRVQALRVVSDELALVR